MFFTLSRYVITDPATLFDMAKGRVLRVAGGKGGSKSRPFLFPGQAEVGADIFQDILPDMLQGVPGVGALMAMNQGLQGVSRQFAHRGLSGSGMDIAATAAAPRALMAQQGQERADAMRLALAPAGVVQKGGTGLFGKHA